jgi:catechol 2,3-dioxygenase-like lactoylglutathione lyase family enzyme
MTSIRHIAVFVPDLRATTAHYQPLFKMELIGREAKLDDGLWYTLPFEKNWDDASAEIQLGMLALRKGDFILALFQGETPPGQVFAVGLTMVEAELAHMRARLPSDTELLEDDAGALIFRDPYQIMWQNTIPGNHRRD